MPAAYVLLVLSIGAAWLPPLRLRTLSVTLWPAVYAAAVLVAWHEGFVEWQALIALVALIGLALAVRRTQGASRWLAFALLLALSAALALHLVPGFRNPVVMAMRFSPDAIPFIQYLNFDKGSVGLVLVALLAPVSRRDGHPTDWMRETGVAFAGTTGVVLGVAAIIGLVRLDPKLPAVTPSFLVVNLFLTCVAEQALFRLLVQDPLQGAHPDRRRQALAVGATGLLFGIAHAAGGPSMIVVATLAGIGYAAVYAKTGSIESAILVHFGLNATHFLLFSYPALRVA
jgi:membrane protease YdiL (CAAX protease family)